MPLLGGLDVRGLCALLAVKTWLQMLRVRVAARVIRSFRLEVCLGVAAIIASDVVVVLEVVALVHLMLANRVRLAEVTQTVLEGVLVATAHFVLVRGGQRLLLKHLNLN